ncbi:MAG: hypothetical protein LBD65_02785, partial [Spirochaetaceae bacterium]|nr:hypothetical protein [Spirochaetaceae bacterium]
MKETMIKHSGRFQRSAGGGFWPDKTDFRKRGPRSAFPFKPGLLKQILGLGFLLMVVPACTTPPAAEKAPA